MNTEISDVQRTKTNRKLLVGLLVAYSIVCSLTWILDNNVLNTKALLITHYSLLLAVCVWVAMKQLSVKNNPYAVAGFVIALLLCLLLMNMELHESVFDLIATPTDALTAFFAILASYIISQACLGICIITAICMTTERVPIISYRSALKTIMILFLTSFLGTITAFISSLGFGISFFQEHPEALYVSSELITQLCFSALYYFIVVSFFGHTRKIGIAGLCQPKDEETCKEVEAKTPGFNRAPNTEERSFMLSPLIFMIPVLLLFVMVDSVYESAMASPLFYNAGYIIMLLKYPMLFIAAAFIGTIGTRKEGVSTAKLSITIVSLGFIAGSLMLASYLLYHALAFQASAFGTALGIAVLVLMCLLLIIPLALTICAYTDKQFKVMPPRHLALKNTLLAIAPLAFIAVSLVITGLTITDGTATTASDILMNFFEPEPPLIAMLKGWLDPLLWLVALATVWRFSRQVDASRCRRVA